MLIDSHAHLTMPQFADDRDAVIHRARKAGLKHIVTIGTDMTDCPQAIALAELYEDISATVGIHPHDVKDITDDIYGQLKAWTAHRKVVAIGEIGLDFHRNLSPPDEQRRHFRRQLQLAREVSLPVVVHDREAHREVVGILREERAEQIGGVIHCFSGDWDMARICLDMGFYISIPGTVTFKGAEELHTVIRKIPVERLLVETDCPFLSPHPMRGKRNEPAHVRFVAQSLAAIKNRDVAELEEQVTRNTEQLFSLSP